MLYESDYVFNVQIFHILRFNSDFAIFCVNRCNELNYNTLNCLVVKNGFFVVLYVLYNKLEA
jgi:hypothetical protein